MSISPITVLTDPDDTNRGPRGPWRPTSFETRREAAPSHRSQPGPAPGRGARKGLKSAAGRVRTEPAAATFWPHERPARRYSENPSLPMGRERRVSLRYLVVGAGLTNPMFFTNSSPLQTPAKVVSVLDQPSKGGCAGNPAGGS